MVDDQAKMMKQWKRLARRNQNSTTSISLEKIGSKRHAEPMDCDPQMKQYRNFKQIGCGDFPRKVAREMLNDSNSTRLCNSLDYMNYTFVTDNGGSGGMELLWKDNWKLILAYQVGIFFAFMALLYILKEIASGESPPIFEKLDRALCNTSWRLLFPDEAVLHLPRIGSDHAPIILNTMRKPPKRNPNHKFEFYWTDHTDFKDILKSSWDNSTGDTTTKLQDVGEKLKKWSKDTFGDTRREIENEKQKIVDLQVTTHLTDTTEEEKSICNRIACLEKRDVMLLSAIPSAKEIFGVVKKMGSLMSPGPYGYPVLFYRKLWEIIGAEVVQLIQDVFRFSYLSSDKAHTLIMNYVKTASFFILLNGQPKGFFVSERGIKQGKSVPESYEEEIITNLGVSIMRKEEKYLGVKILQQGLRVSNFNFLIEKFEEKLKEWKRNSLSHAGRAILIQSVLALIPVYFMATSLIPKTDLNKLTQIIRDFWRGHSRDKRKMHFLKWEWFNLPKEKGGPELRSLSDLNQDLVTKLAWRFLKDQEILWEKILLAKYLRDKNF
ncbi:uncharacterized protein LOC113359882 [Papaver somniferum]|uniref:uncharacterized protein LOC113359882 n=1 Tax=Papaver somniferum TaxID=3469 RepID=UPI000E6FF76F|nr:uncharacterized protein LOC113359882 [Papaver somniferum]